MPDEGVSARPIPVGELGGLAFARGVAVLHRLIQGIGASVHILETKGERAREPEKRIGPVRAELRSFAEGEDGVGQFLFRFLRFTSCLVRLAVDAVQVALTVAKPGTE